MNSEKAKTLVLAGKAPGGLTVSGGLDLSGCTGLTSLPDGLTVSDKIIQSPGVNLQRKKKNAAIPDKLRILGMGVEHIAFDVSATNEIKAETLAILRQASAMRQLLLRLADYGSLENISNIQHEARFLVSHIARLKQEALER